MASEEFRVIAFGGGINEDLGPEPWDAYLKLTIRLDNAVDIRSISGTINHPYNNDTFDIDLLHSDIISSSSFSSTTTTFSFDVTFNTGITAD